MATKAIHVPQMALPASCTLAGQTFPVRLSNLTCDGCLIEADTAWPAECDFLRLSLPGGVDINGRGYRSGAGRVLVRFFGELHPVAVRGLRRYLGA